MTRFAIAFVLAGLALLGGAGPAAAHDSLVSADPADGATMSTGPQRITLTFDQPLQREFVTITVTGPDGTRWDTGDISTSGPSASSPVLPLGPAGRYTIGYRIISADGHPVSGALHFELTQAGTGTPAPASEAGAQPAAGDDGPPAWPLAIAVVLLVAAGVVVALRFSRGPSGRGPGRNGPPVDNS